MPDTRAIWPIPAVMSMPSPPPIMTRSVVLSTRAPAVLALTTPVRSKPATVNPTMLQALASIVGAKAPAKGIKPPTVKLIAEATAA